MNQVQRWFERIVGVTPQERERYEFACAHFGRRPFDGTALHVPACWRRSAVHASRKSPAQR